MNTPQRQREFRAEPEQENDQRFIDEERFFEEATAALDDLEHKSEQEKIAGLARLVRILITRGALSAGLEVPSIVQIRDQAVER